MTCSLTFFTIILTSVEVEYGEIRNIRLLEGLFYQALSHLELQQFQDDQHHVRQLQLPSLLHQVPQALLHGRRGH